MNTPAANRTKVRMDKATQTRVLCINGNDGGMHDQAADTNYVRPWPCRKDHGHDRIYTDAGGALRCRMCESERRREDREENRERERLYEHQRKAKKRRAEGRTYPEYRPGRGKRGTGEYA